MSQENVDIVRQAYEAFAAGEVEATGASFAPDAIHHAYPE
jgi:ketosteroid isomerase-like protein